MKKLFLSFLLVLFVGVSAKADEGMWLLKELNRQSEARMKELGFTFPMKNVYNEKKASLKDAVVIFGRGCTGVAVSKEGLIFTNHHCGYGDIQQLSSVENDYLRDGFMAKTKSDELYSEGLIVSFLRSTKDVTKDILSKVPSVLAERERGIFIDSISNEMEKKFSKDEFTSVRIVPFYAGNKYMMVTYDVFKDVRMVLAPPSSVGKFGGDTDNWMWPRHTGDFSVFRVYADKKNRPAKYSADNVPFKPSYIVPVSLAGVQTDDYAMTIGYPGSTRRYLSSWGIQQMMKSSNEPRIEVRGLKQDIWKEAMKNSDATRIKYASKYARSSNYWKNSMGMNTALVKLNVISDKEALENKLKTWIESNPSAKAKYGDVLPSLEKSYGDLMINSLYSTFFTETFFSGTEIIGLSNLVGQYNPKASEAVKEKFMTERVKSTYKDYEPQLDQKLLPALLKLYAEKVPANFLPSIYETIEKEFDGDYKKYSEWLFNNSIAANEAKVIEFLNAGKMEDYKNDPAAILAASIVAKYSEIATGLTPIYMNIKTNERLFMAALMEMDPNKAYSPDANFTQRLSYGSVKAYDPYDGATYHPTTTTKGVLEKQKPGDYEFNVQPYILDILRKNDFGRYADKDGKMVTCFLSDNDITGGNSGSPVFNGNAELIGLAFDGNWEALSGDIVFYPAMQRTISVDIRYVLFVMDKIMNAPHLVDELTIKN